MRIGNFHPIAWYGSREKAHRVEFESFAIALVGSGFQFWIGSDRTRYIDLIVIVASVLFGFFRLVLARIEDLDRSVKSYHGLSVPAGSSRAITTLWQGEVNRTKSVLAALSEGEIEIVSQDELEALLHAITKQAESKIYTVDHIGLDHWYTRDGLQRYLKLQYLRAYSGECEVRRLRFVTETELSDPNLQVLLHDFVNHHEESNAKIALCPAYVAESLFQSKFAGRTGALLTDAEDVSAGVVLVGHLGAFGRIINSRVYFSPKHLADCIGHLADFQNCWERTIDDGWDAKMRAQLNQSPITISVREALDNLTKPRETWIATDQSK